MKSNSLKKIYKFLIKENYIFKIVGFFRVVFKFNGLVKFFFVFFILFSEVFENKLYIVSCYEY